MEAPKSVNPPFLKVSGSPDVVHGLRLAAAVVAAALILALVDIVSVSSMRDFVPWSGSLVWMVVISIICGVLLALISPRAAWMIVAASVVAVLVFASLWSYTSWVLLEPYISLLDLSVSDVILSDMVILYVSSRGAVMFMSNAAFGLLGAVATLAFLPGGYHL